MFQLSTLKITNWLFHSLIRYRHDQGTRTSTVSSIRNNMLLAGLRLLRKDPEQSNNPLLRKNSSLQPMPAQKAKKIQYPCPTSGLAFYRDFSDRCRCSQYIQHTLLLEFIRLTYTHAKHHDDDDDDDDEIVVVVSSAVSSIPSSPRYSFGPLRRRTIWRH